MSQQEFDNLYEENKRIRLHIESAENWVADCNYDIRSKGIGNNKNEKANKARNNMADMLSNAIDDINSAIEILRFGWNTSA